MSMPIYVIIPRRLYQSGIITGPEGYDFDVIVNVDMTSDVNTLPSEWPGMYIHFPFMDGAISKTLARFPDETILRSVAKIVADLIETGEKRILVRCQGGLNRSSMVNARALMYLGFSADRAISHVRLCRSPWALSNMEFVNWLKSEERMESLRLERAEKVE